LKEQLLLLLRLQEIDSRVLEIRASMQALPKKLEPAKQDLAKLAAMLETERERLAETERWRREQESFIQLEDEDIKKAKAKLQAAKSSKDYAAASREVENKRKSKSDREEELLKVMEALEKGRAEMQAHETDVDALRKHVEEEEARIAETVAGLETEAVASAEGRGDITAQIKPRTLKRYEHTLKKRKPAVVHVEDGVCSGCHMALPPQLNNVLARFDSIETCPRCNRIIYRLELLTAGDSDD
jgi:hypothetical protein